MNMLSTKQQYDIFRTNHALVEELTNSYKSDHANGGQTIAISQALAEHPEWKNALQIADTRSEKAFRNYVRYYVLKTALPGYAYKKKQQLKAKRGTIRRETNGTIEPRVTTPKADNRKSTAAQFCPRCGCDMRAVNLAMTIGQ